MFPYVIILLHTQDGDVCRLTAARLFILNVLVCLRRIYTNRSWSVYDLFTNTLLEAQQRKKKN